MDEPIQDGIAKRGVADELVPVVDGDLAGDEGRAATAAIFDDLEEIAALAIAERSQAPIIEDQEVGLRKLLEEPPVRAVAPRGRQLTEEARQADVADDVPLLTPAVAERAG